MTTTTRDYSLTGPDSAAAVEAGLAEADWYTTPIPRKRLKELMQRSDRRALIDNVGWLVLMIVFATIGVATWFSWVSLLAFACYGVLYGSGGDSRWHECGHRTAFKTTWLNDVFYQIACFCMMRNPTAWRWSHTRHHTDTIVVGRDPEILAMRPPRMGRIIPNLVGLIDVPESLWTMVKHASGRLSADEAEYIPEPEQPKVFREARIWTVIYAGVIGVTVATGSILPLMVIGLPRMYGAWHHVLTGLIQHAGLADNVLDHRLNTRTAYLNPISRFIYLDMNYHVEHHMFPLVPYHNLADLHEEMKHDSVPASSGFVAAFREIVPALRRQRRNPEFFIDRRPQLATYETERN